MGQIHVIEGPVGAGKTTFAWRLAQHTRTPPFVLDAWMVTLFRPDRPATDLWPWYRARKDRCQTQIWSVARGLLDLGQDAIVELGLITAADRADFLSKVAASGHSATIHLLDAPRAERWRRVQSRNATKGASYAMEVPEDVFNMASDHWEPLTDQERARHTVIDAS